MRGYSANIEQETVNNNDFRRVLYTGKHAQLVLMSIAPGDEIGAEVHNGNDQFFRFEAGQGTVSIEDNQYQVRHGSAIIVPAGSKHNVVNTSASQALKLYTLYAPSHHKDGIVRATRQEAEANDQDFDGITTE